MVNREYQVWDIKGEEEEDWIVFYRFATSYKKAFQTLIDKEISDASLGYNYNDEDILPIFLNFFQFVELAFKSLLIKKGNKTQGHELDILLQEVKKEYPDLALSKNSEIFLTGTDLDDRNIKMLNYFRLKYPTDREGNRYWITENKLGSFFSLQGIVIITSIVIEEIENYFKKIL